MFRDKVTQRNQEIQTGLSQWHADNADCQNFRRLFNILNMRKSIKICAICVQKGFYFDYCLCVMNNLIKFAALKGF